MGLNLAQICNVGSKIDPQYIQLMKSIKATVWCTHVVVNEIALLNKLQPRTNKVFSNVC